MHNTGSFNKLSPQRLLRQLVNCSESSCLQAFSNTVSWSIYIEQGKIIYATDSLEPFDRLERHLRMVSQQNSLLSSGLLTSETRVQLRLLFEPEWQIEVRENYDNSLDHLPEYQAIHWLVTEKQLLSAQAAVLIRELVREVIESFLLIGEGEYELQATVNSLPIICSQDIENMIKYCQSRSQIWQSFAPQITSPYQRPYLLINSKFYDKRLPELQQHLTSWMKGFSLRHLAVILNQDEIQLAQTLYPHILSGSIILHEADPPFDKLPKVFEESSDFPKYITELDEKELVLEDVLQTNISVELISIPEKNPNNQPYISPEVTDDPDQLTIADSRENTITTVKTNTFTPEKNYKILSVDDSPTMLKEISRFLEEEKFSVVTVNEAIKAVMSIIRHKPDLILLDLNMAGIDGYELCRIIRNNSLFKEVPIIFVTGNKGIIDKVKARMVGASGYLTKPFTRAELMRMVFMHLT